MPLLQSAPLRLPGALPPLLPPEQLEQESQSLLGAGLSGLAWVGDTLDTLTGARFARAALQGLSGGEVAPSEYLALGPLGWLTDTIGLTDRQNIVAPNDLAVQWGMGENEPGLDWNDARDIGLGILFDPATYLSGGLTAAGKIAKGAGMYPKAIRNAKGALEQGSRQQALTSTLDDLIGTNQGLRTQAENFAQGSKLTADFANDPLRSGIFGVKLPFQKRLGLGDDPLMSFGGERLGSAMDSFFDRLRYGEVPGQPATSIGGKALDAVGAGVRNLAPLVSKPLQGFDSRMGQVAAADKWAEAKAAEVAAREDIAGDILDLNRAGVTLTPEISSIIRTGLELGPEEAAVRLYSAGLAGKQVDVVRGVLKKRRDRLGDLLKTEQQAALKTEELDDIYLGKQNGVTQAVPTKRRISKSQKEQFFVPGRTIITPAGAFEVIEYAPGESKVLVKVLDKETGLPTGARKSMKASSLAYDWSLIDAGIIKPSGDDVFKELGPEAATRLGYAPRSATLPRGAKRDTSDIYNARHQYQGYRADDVRGVTTETLNDISIDPVVSGKNRTAGDYKSAAAHIESTYGVPAEKAQELAVWARKLNPIHAEIKSPAFANDPFVDMMMRETAGAEAVAVSNTIRKMVTELGSEIGDVKVSKVLDNAGLSLERARENWGIDIDNLYVDKATAGELARSMKMFTSPDEVNKIVDLLIDRPTNFFRSTVTAPFPAFHSRNRVSGTAINYVIGGLSRFAHKGAKKLLAGDEIEKASDFPAFKDRGLTDAQATDELRKEIFAHNIMGPGQAQALSSSAEGVAGGSILENIPGLTPATSYWGALKKAVPKSWDEAKPWNTAGVATEGDVFSLVAAGRAAGDTVEGMNRATPYIEFRRKGMNPTEAAARVKAAHVDYSSLTQVERRYARKIFPFWSYASRMLPWTLRNLIDEPAGMVRQSTRAANVMAGDDQGLLPAHIQSRFTIPIGEEDAEGNQKFFQGLDLPWESTFDLVRGGPTTFGTVKNTLGGLIGQMNPLLRAPLEIGSGYDFFSGRRLEDVDSTLGRIGSNITGAEEPYYVNPLIEKGLQGVGGGLNRALTMGRQLGDDRKTWTDIGLNFLTGAKITDQPMDRQRSIAARDLISESLRGQPGTRTFEHLYVPQDRMHLLSPENQRRYTLYRSLAAEAQRKARERKAEEN